MIASSSTSLIIAQMLFIILFYSSIITTDNVYFSANLSKKTGQNLSGSLLLIKRDVTADKEVFMKTFRYSCISLSAITFQKIFVPFSTG